MMLSTRTDTIRHFDVGGAAFSLYDPGDTVAEETLHASLYEPAAIEILRRDLSAARPVFCDVGALYGYYAALATALRPSTIVHSFEPNPEFVEIVKQNFEANRVRGHVHAVALSEQTSTELFAGRTIVGHDAPGVMHVPSVTFDDFFGGSRMPATFVKIDVHGAEGKVLQGMHRSLRTFVDRVLVEVHAQHILVGAYAYADFLDMLESAGFTVYEVAEFRTSDDVLLTPLRGDARERFVRYDRWTAQEISAERMLYAVRNPG